MRLIILLLLVAGCTLPPAIQNITNDSFTFKSACGQLDSCRVLRGDEAALCCFKAAELQKNPDFCEDTGNESGNCYASLAIILEQPTLCMLAVSAEPECNRILAYRLNDLSLCSKVQPEKIENCFSTISVLTNDTRGCTSAGSFSDACYFGIATKKLDVSLCSSAGKFQQECISAIAVGTNDSILCGNLTTLRTSCLEHINGTKVPPPSD